VRCRLWIEKPCRNVVFGWGGGEAGSLAQDLTAAGPGGSTHTAGEQPAGQPAVQQGKTAYNIYK
jgi:hypothetical protein